MHFASRIVKCKMRYFMHFAKKSVFAGGESAKIPERLGLFQRREVVQDVDDLGIEVASLPRTFANAIKQPLLAHLELSRVNLGLLGWVSPTSVFMAQVGGNWKAQRLRSFLGGLVPCPKAGDAQSFGWIGHAETIRWPVMQKALAIA